MGEFVRIQSTSWMKFIRMSSHVLSTVVMMSFLFLLSSCNNLGSLKNRVPSSSVSLSDPFVSTTAGNFMLITVLPSQQSPGSQYDMVGQDSEFDTYCNQGLDGSCKCEYTYVSPGVGTQTVQGDVNYSESNLIRCTNEVPSGINSFDVRIVTDGSVGYTSNTITVNLNNGAFANSTNYIDLSKEDAYQMVRRFQCRKRSFIASPMDGTLIDPIQSEDPKVIYPFNFYTTNVAQSLWQMQQLSNQEWDCTLTPTQDHSLHWWANPNVYSASPCTDAFCAGDNELLYPQSDLVSRKIPVLLPSAGRRRSSFFLAKQSYGVFQVPLKAAVAPMSYTSSKTQVIGYAARPIPGAGGSSSCPSITLPSNAQWVKVWNFRATDITPPKYVESTVATRSAGVACNPNKTLFESCYQPADSGVNTPWRQVAQTDLPATMAGSSVVFSNPTSSQPATSQVLVANATTTIASRIIGVGNVNACYNISAMGNGREAWDPSPFGFNASITLAGMKALPWTIYDQVQNKNSCSTSFEWVDHTGGAFCGGFRLMEDEPRDTQLTNKTLNDDNYTDQLFVVSDPNVDDSLMINQATSVSHYKPVTYRTSADCSGVSRSGCASYKELHWDINVKEVGNPTGSDMFPLCVLQFTE